MTELQTRVGSRIRDHRTRLGLTQENLAERAGLSYKFIGEVERGAGNPTLTSLAAIADGLRVDLSELVAPVRESGYSELSMSDFAILRDALDSIEAVIGSKRNATRETKTRPRRVRKR